VLIEMRQPGRAVAPDEPDLGDARHADLREYLCFRVSLFGPWSFPP
jgi:hypothetical protein